MRDELQDQYLKAIFQFKRFVTTEVGNDTIEAKKGISLSELIFLRSIAKNTFDTKQNVRLTEVREYLSITKSAISQLLSGLERKGLINREIDKNNRRNLIVTLTDQGHKVLKAIDSEFTKEFEKMAKHIGKNTIKQMLTTLSELIEYVNRAKSKGK